MKNFLDLRFCILALIAVLSASCTGQPATEVADTVYSNGRIYTVNEAQPWAEALAVKDGRFFVVGSNADMEAVTGDNTEVVDLGGRFVMPGVNDLHHHGIEISTNAVNPDALTLTEQQQSSHA